MLTLDQIYTSRHILRNVARTTDLIYAPNLSNGAKIYLKTENLQITGSFKLRGAYCKITQLSDEDKKKGVIACSAGNHAQGVALAAQKENISAMICVPDGAPISKVEATKRYGAEVIFAGETYDDAYKKAIQLQKETGRIFIHPFDDEQVIAGQGTIGLEIIEQLEDIDAVIVPIGGGGLIAGVSYAIKNLNPKCKVYGVQASGAASMLQSVEHHHIEELNSVSTVADGIAVKKPGELTFEICEKYVDEIASVTDDEISSAILALIEEQKLIAEGAGAVSVAAVLSKKFDLENKKVVCLVSGGNIDVNILSRVITRGMMKSGRTVNLTIALTDKPGQLYKVSKIVADLGANVVAVYHDRADKNMAITDCFLKLTMETRNHEHVREICEALRNVGYEITAVGG